jgi:hypothetical protein
LALAATAFATKVIEVLLLTESTVPIKALVEEYKRFPTVICVLKVVPAPVIAVEPSEAVRVPVRIVMGHAEALQFPLAIEVMTAADATDVDAVAIMKSTEVRKKRRNDFMVELSAKVDPFARRIVIQLWN